jgi:hypothetical protein
MQTSDRLADQIRILPANVSGRRQFLCCNAKAGVFRDSRPAPASTQGTAGLCGAGFAPILPVAMSALQDALPRTGASQR